MHNDISNDRAIQIATNWLKDNKLPACLSVQESVLDQSTLCWQIAIGVSKESNLPVGQLFIDAKTGKVTYHTSVETIIQLTTQSDFDDEVLTAARRFMDKHSKLLGLLAQ